MKNAQKPDHISLNTLINWLREGRFAVPDFQREFEWKPWDIRDLMRSIFLDYYIGSLLLWRSKRENFETLSCESLFGSQDAGRADYIVLDGQQRLTAIHYAFFQPDEPLPGRANPFFYWVDVRRFLDEEHDEAFGYDRRTRRWRELLQDRERQFAEHVFPLSVLGAGGFELFDWIRAYEGFWQRRADEFAGEGREAEAAEAARFANGAKIFGEHVRELTGEYQISYIELDRDIEVEKVCDIFTQINSRGVRLDTFDLINALLKPKGCSSS
jgi:Protein of unknown function DUF262